MNWIKVKDKFPDLTKKMLILKGNEIGFFDPKSYPPPNCSGLSSYTIEMIDYWMPLPELPKDNK